MPEFTLLQFTQTWVKRTSKGDEANNNFLIRASSTSHSLASCFTILMLHHSNLCVSAFACRLYALQSIISSKIKRVKHVKSWIIAL